MSTTNDISQLLPAAWEAFLAQRQATSQLSSTMEDLLHKIAQMEAPTPEDEDARLEVVSDLTERLSALGTSAGGSLGAVPHGSFVMGCFTSASALEVAVTGRLPGSAQGGEAMDVERLPPQERLQLLERVHGLVRDSGMAAQGTVAINRTARVPSVSFEHAGSGIPVRVCVAYPGFALRAHVVRGLMQQEPRLRSLTQLVELWAEARGLNNPAAGTFNSWALMNLVFFAVQTFQSQPLLPPLWRMCGITDSAVSGATAAGAMPGATSGGGAGVGPAGATGTSAGGAQPGAAGAGGAAVAAAASAGGAAAAAAGNASTGGAAPAVLRPLQHHAYMRQPSSESLAPVLRDILARLAGPADALAVLAAGSSSGGAPAPAAGLLPLFHWFLVLLDGLMGRWQLSWNRRWRVSTWHGQLVAQPFSRAFLVPVECPFDAADNAAKSLGCENQSKHQQVFRSVAAEVAASLRLLNDTRAPEDLDKAVLGLFGLEVEHLYLEEEEDPEPEPEPTPVVEVLKQSAQAQEQQVEEDAGAGPHDQSSQAQARQKQGTPQRPAGLDVSHESPQHHHQQQQVTPSAQVTPTRQAAPGSVVATPSPAASAGARLAAAALVASSPVAQVRARPLDAEELRQQQHQHLVARASSPAGQLWHPLMAAAAAAAAAAPGTAAEGMGSPSGEAAAAGGAGLSPTRSAPSGPAPASRQGSQGGAVLGVASEPSMMDLFIEAVVGQPPSPPQPQPVVATAAPPAAATPPLPTSSRAAVMGPAPGTPAALRANAMVQRPLSPLLRDVTNGIQRTINPGADANKAPAQAADGSADGAGGGVAAGGGGYGFEGFGLFGSFLEGARRLFDNVAQGVAELGEDLNELAATTAATLRAVINDDEDLPFLGSSTRRVKKHRLQLLHRPPAGAVASAGGPGSASGPGSLQGQGSQGLSSPGSSSAGSGSQPRPRQSQSQSQPQLQADTRSPLQSPAGGRHSAVVAGPGAGRSPGPARAQRALQQQARVQEEEEEEEAQEEAMMGVLPGMDFAAVSAAASAAATPTRGPGAGGEWVVPASSRARAAAAAEPAQSHTPAVAAVAAPGSTSGTRHHPHLYSTPTRSMPAALAAAAAATGGAPSEVVDAAATAAAIGAAATVAASSNSAAQLSAMQAEAAAVAAAVDEIVATAADVVEARSRPASTVTSPSKPVGCGRDPVSPREGSAGRKPVSVALELAAAAAAAAEASEQAQASRVSEHMPDSSPRTLEEAEQQQQQQPAALPSAHDQAPALEAGQAGSFESTGAAPEAAVGDQAAAAAPAAAMPAPPASGAAAAAPARVAPVEAAQAQGASEDGPLVRLGSTAAPSTCGSLTEDRASAASSPTAASSRSFAPTPTRRAALAPPLPPQLGAAGGTASASAPGAPRAPPPIPPPPPPPIGMGGLRVKSAIFRKGTAREAPATSGAASASSAAGASAPAAAAAAGAVPAEAAATAAAAAAAPAPPRTVMELSSGRLQDLAEAIDRAPPHTTIDLQGATFSGPLTAPTMKLTSEGVWLVRGVLVLQPEQQLLVAAKATRLEDLVLRDVDAVVGEAAAEASAAAAAEVPVASASGASAAAAGRPAVLVTKQSYAAGGALALERCRLELGRARGVGLQVKGKGCSVAASHCAFSGSAQAAVLVTDAALSMSGCSLAAGAGLGLSCRDNGTAAASNCELRAFGGACAAVAAGGSVELSSCRLYGSADRDAAAEVTDAPCSSAVHAAAGAKAAERAGSCGLLAEGKGSTLTARGCSLAGFAGQAAAVVTVGAGAVMDDCAVTGSLHAALVGTRGGRLQALRCEFSGHAAAGLVVGEGATADLRECRLLRCGGPGLRVGGVGSMAVLRGCEVAGNAATGVAVGASGCATLDSCNVTGNGSHGPGPGAGEASAVEGCAAAASELEPGHGLKAEGAGARASAQRSAFCGNAGAGVAAGEHGLVQLTGCRMEDNSATAATSREAVGPGGNVGAGVQVEVAAHGRVLLSGGCTWRCPGDEAPGSGAGLRVVALGSLEVLE